MSSLLKAYLMGSDDPFILAKAYYDDLVKNDNLILKDVEAVENKIMEELGFVNVNYINLFNPNWKSFSWKDVWK